MAAGEFEYIMDLLAWSRLGKTPAGKKELVQIIANLTFSADDWHPEDPEYIDKLIQCTQYTLPFFSVSIIIVILQIKNNLFSVLFGSLRYWI